MFLGLILLITGVVFLLKNLGYISEPAWSIIWPVILIVIGFWTLLKKGRRGGFYFGEWCDWRKWWKEWQEKKEGKPSQVLRKRSKLKDKIKMK